MKYEKTIEKTIGEYDIFDGGDGEKHDYSTTFYLEKVEMPDRECPWSKVREVVLVFKSHDLPYMQDKGQESQHPEFHSVIKKGNKVRVKFSIEVLDDGSVGE